MHNTQKLLNLLLSKPVVTLPEIMKLKIASHTKAISNLRQAGYLITNKKYWPRVGKSEYVLNWWSQNDVYIPNEMLAKMRKWSNDMFNEMGKKLIWAEWYCDWIRAEQKSKDTSNQGTPIGITKKSYTTAISVKNNKKEIVINDAWRRLSASISQSQRDDDIAKQLNEQPKQTSQWLFNQIIKRFKSL